MYYSFIILKPDALERHLTLEILKRLQANNITIEVFDYRLIDEDIILKHYAQIIGQLGEAFKNRVISAFVGKYVIPVIVSSDDENIIQVIRKTVGATDPSKADAGTIRGDLSSDSMEKSALEGRCCNNLIHASDSYDTYLFESRLWLGEDVAQRYINSIE